MNSKVKCLVQVPAQTKWASVALLLLRLVVGIAFILHGFGKIQNPFGWMPPGSPVPGFFQFLAALSEFGGGIALVLGLLTRLGSLGIAITMAVATCMHAFVLHDPFVNLTGGGAFELPFVYMMIAILFISMGPGKFSADDKVFGNSSC
ncbi:MAG: DoxX family protein [Bdellovibrio sp.]|nr:DoxX family protein [Bdellovibrio sp.]